MNEPHYSVDEFERESRYIENLVWDALVIAPGTSVLFCGYGPDGRWVKRAIDARAVVSVIEHRDDVIRAFEHLGAEQLRGSTSVIPARSNAYDLAIAFHYLHEADPFFHAQIVSELARVARRVCVVEPGPPADPLGKRIARLYSQAKRELNQFEYYQPLEYWKKLLRSVKADVAQHIFAFAKVPPREYLIDTIELILDTMAAGEVPEPYLKELRDIATRSDVQLLPQPRYVLVGAALGDLPQPVFTPREEPSPTPGIAMAARAVSASAGYEFPPVDPPDEPAAAFVPGLPLGAPKPPDVPNTRVPEGTPPPATPFGSPFAVPAEQPQIFGVPGLEMPEPGWQWEPPESGDEKPKEP